ncbi:hypothetical protein [Rhodococcoides fascians]|uniref:hypothetical protein n=1 Tax=Rhodococcoides fascians TaxID=1828 RepID=UPI00055C0482|nr:MULTISPECIES: hypothetical protein [Rhodococcus]OZF20358.1 hypothetical protein CH299_04620 [Rhodococcus sp. 14-2686-1-2]
MVAVQVETARESVWQPDGMQDATYPPGGIVLRDLLARPNDTELRPVTSPIAGYGMYPIDRKDRTLTSVEPKISLDVTYEGTGTSKMVKDVSATVSADQSSSRSLGPIVVQTKLPTPVKAGDQVNYAGQFVIRRSGDPVQRDSNGNRTGIRVRVSLWGVSNNSDEYGEVSFDAVELLAYETLYQPSSISWSYANTLVTLPAASPATIPAGVTGVHMTVALRAATTGEWISPSYTVPNWWGALTGGTPNMFTFSNADPLRLIVNPVPPVPAQPPAAQWSTLTQEQNRLWRFTFEDVTDHVVRIGTERIEADLAVHTIRLYSTDVPDKVKAGRRVRMLALHPDGSFTVLAVGTIRTRRIVHDGRHKPQVEIGVHDSHGKLMATTAKVAFDTLAEYGPILNTLGIEAAIDGTEVTGPSRELPEWGGAFPSYQDQDLTVWDSLVMARNARKGFVRLTRTDRLEVLSALPAEVVLDVSDVPGEGDMSYALNVEFGSDSAELINSVRVQEHLIDSEDFTDRTVSTEDPPKELTAIAGRTQTAEYRRQSSIDAYGLSSRSFPVVRGSGAWADIEAGNYGSNFAAWANAILDEYSIEQSGPRAITLPITTAAQRRLVSRLDVLDAAVVRFRGDAQVRRIRQINHTIQPGRWSVELRFDTTGEQTYWLPATPVPLITLGDTDAGTLTAPSTGLVDGGHPTDTETYVLDGGTL